MPGKHLGFAAIVAVSLLGFLAGFLLLRTWIGQLGFVPIMIGLRYLAPEEREDQIRSFLSWRVKYDVPEQAPGLKYRAAGPVRPRSRDSNHEQQRDRKFFSGLLQNRILTQAPWP